MSQQLPGGRWTVVQFPQGAPSEALGQLVLELMQAPRPPREKWCAMLGEFFMGEGAPVLLLSPALAPRVLPGLADAIELFGPVRVRKSERGKLAFRGRMLCSMP